MRVLVVLQLTTRGHWLDVPDLVLCFHIFSSLEVDFFRSDPLVSEAAVTAP
jgi:hypothetical protein